MTACHMWSPVRAGSNHAQLQVDHPWEDAPGVTLPPGWDTPHSQDLLQQPKEGCTPTVAQTWGSRGEGTPFHNPSQEARSTP